LFEAGTGLGVLLGLGLAVGDADGAADAELADADGEAEDPGSSSPHAAISKDARRPSTSTALAGKKRTGKPYPPRGPEHFAVAAGRQPIAVSGMR
jgi:hypothetical protein